MSAEQILQLKVCDPAMGSGAFLVEACRFLGEAVHEAWRKSGELPALLEAHGDARLHAKRLVAQRCLYGVDKNAAAVELAKLSLWLETLSGDLPFTFLDHVLRHGDSLVGLDLTQVRSFHWSPEGQLPTVATLVDAALREVKEHRDAIQALADDESDAAQKDKRRLYDLAGHAMERVKLVADVCVGAFFSGTKAKEREEERKKRLAVVEAYLSGDEELRPTLDTWAEAIRHQHAPFHWHLELPEVFFLERPDPLEGGKSNGAAFMDAFVGNPPFMGGRNLSTSSGEEYGEWLDCIHEGGRGADLSAQFFVRAADLLGTSGAVGFIATNTVAQGVSRAYGLQRLVSNGFQIYNATPSLAWPGDAAVVVSVVHLAKGAPIMRSLEVQLNDRTVAAVNSMLREGAELADPVALQANGGRAFQGAILLGMGFTISPAERDSLIAADPRNGARIREYIGGQEVNTDPRQSPDRYVIDFGEMDEATARKWPELWAILSERVRPERVTKDAKRYPRMVHEWWKFWNSRPEMQRALEGNDQCIVTARVSKHLCMTFQPTSRVFSEQLCVFALSSHTALAVLQSRVHEAWARLLSSSMKTDLRYSVSDCFETFPFPTPSPVDQLAELESLGRELFEMRRDYMVSRVVGLTTIYNLLKSPASMDPEVVALRRLHEQVDRAVLLAYGWSDIALPDYDDPRGVVDSPFFRETVQRLSQLNAVRAQRLQPLKAAVSQKRRRDGGSSGQGELF